MSAVGPERCFRLQSGVSYSRRRTHHDRAGAL